MEKEKPIEEKEEKKVEIEKQKDNRKLSEFSAKIITDIINQKNTLRERVNTLDYYIECVRGGVYEIDKFNGLLQDIIILSQNILKLTTGHNPKNILKDIKDYIDTNTSKVISKINRGFDTVNEDRIVDKINKIFEDRFKEHREEFFNYIPTNNMNFNKNLSTNNRDLIYEKKEGEKDILNKSGGVIHLNKSTMTSRDLTKVNHEVIGLSKKEMRYMDKKTIMKMPVKCSASYYADRVSINFGEDQSVILAFRNEKSFMAVQRYEKAEIISGFSTKYQSKFKCKN